MSRIAKMAIIVPAKVEVSLTDTRISVKGHLGYLSQELSNLVKIEKDDATLLFSPTDNSSEADAMSGTLRALVNNMVNGVINGFEKKLTLVGVGFRAQVQGDNLNLSLGFSHPIVFKIPEDLSIHTATQTEILVKGISKQRVGQVAAEIRAYRIPEPYKGKGVRYSDETVTLKETKKK
jgi:large subunit ribosomal protein L6